MVVRGCDSHVLILCPVGFPHERRGHVSERQDGQGSLCPGVLGRSVLMGYLLGWGLRVQCLDEEIHGGVGSSCQQVLSGFMRKPLEMLLETQGVRLLECFRDKRSEFPVEIIESAGRRNSCISSVDAAVVCCFLIFHIVPHLLMSLTQGGAARDISGLGRSDTYASTRRSGLAVAGSSRGPREGRGLFYGYGRRGGGGGRQGLYQDLFHGLTQLRKGLGSRSKRLSHGSGSCIGCSFCLGHCLHRCLCFGLRCANSYGVL
jgi:hypothetical protein